MGLCFLALARTRFGRLLGGVCVFSGKTLPLAMNRKLRYDMIGGGRGAFSADPEKSATSGADLFLAPSRVYGTYVEMARAEAARPVADRLDFVVIVTPNHQHFGPAQTFLEAGFHVVCDKPVTLDLAQARTLRDLVHGSGKIFALTHNYTGNALGTPVTTRPALTGRPSIPGALG
jgi:hypothetical protein